MNDLRLIVNNTGSNNLTSSPVNLQGSGDGTSAGLDATLTYTVPEPSSFALLSVAAFVFVAWKRRIKKSES